MAKLDRAVDCCGTGTTPVGKISVKVICIVYVDDTNNAISLNLFHYFLKILNLYSVANLAIFLNVALK